MASYILSLDQGTTSSRALLFDSKANIIAQAQKEFTQYFPKESWVEHNASEIWETQLEVAQKAITNARIESHQIAGIGITNQRETTIIWDRNSMMPLSPAIVWQDRRTALECNKIKESAFADQIKFKTGLIPDSYFSATKIKWILGNVPGAREKAARGELAFGTVDSWLIYKLTNGKVHATDVSNASRTMLYNIRELKWDDELCSYFDIPKSMLPEVKDSSEIVGYTLQNLFGHEIPIAGIAGDQQAALFGQQCFQNGMLKNTYGTGCFLVLNTGDQIIDSSNQLLATIAWKIGDETTYALEGSVFVAGAIIQWLRDGLGLISSAEESENLASRVEDTRGVYFVPALTGLGAPEWDPYARGTIIGISRGAKKEHIVRAALEGIAYQVEEVLAAMSSDMIERPILMKVDGGAAMNNLLMQFQSDISDIQLVRPKILESTALGAAFLAGLAVGFWKSKDDLLKLNATDKVFSSNMTTLDRQQRLLVWKKAIARALNWAEE